MADVTRLAVVAASPEEYMIGEEGPFKFGPLSFRLLGQLDRLLMKYSLTPLEEIGPRLGGIPEPERGRLWAQAMEAARSWSAPSVGSYIGNSMLVDHPDCTESFFRIAIKAFNDVDEETVDRLFASISRGTFIEISKVCLEISDPKVALLAQGESMTSEERESLTKFCDLQDKLFCLRSPLRWITENTSAQ